MKAKFKAGDKVRFTARAPRYITGGLRGRTRTIVSVYYDDADCCNYYELGDRGKGVLGLFRSYMLAPVGVDQLRTRGRPKTKRKYTRRVQHEDPGFSSI